METTITYIRKVPLWQVILGFTFLIISFYQLCYLNFLGLVGLAFAYVTLNTDGAQIDLKSKTYRKITSILGLKFGIWHPMGSAKYISVFNTAESVTVRVETIETTKSSDIILLNLFFEDKTKITIYRTNNAKDAFNVASHIADALIIDLLDATEKGNFRWVDKQLFRNEGQILHINRN